MQSENHVTNPFETEEAINALLTKITLKMNTSIFFLINKLGVFLNKGSLRFRAASLLILLQNLFIT